MYRSSSLMLLGLGALALAAGAAQVASGDLTIRVETTRADEIGELLDALKKMIVSLSGAVGGVREGVEFMDHSIRNIASDNTMLASRTSAQAAALEQVAASIEELIATVKENAQSASHADRLAGSASDIAKQGGQAVTQVVQSMNSIDASSQKISSIINLVEAITFQTNILALNAAVEAARAAEHGRGFAVVAAEVRNLAHRSSLAAKEIKELIQQSVDEIQKGGRLVGEAGSTIEKLVESVGQVSGIMAEIHAASKEQSLALEQISQVVVHMDRDTQKNAALVMGAAQTAEALQHYSEQLSGAMSKFKIADAHVVRHSRDKNLPLETPRRARIEEQWSAKQDEQAVLHLERERLAA